MHRRGRYGSSSACNFTQKAAVYWQLSFYVANAAGNAAADSSAF